MGIKDELNRLSDDELLLRLSDVLKQSRCVESVLVAHIAEVDARRLFASLRAPLLGSPIVGTDYESWVWRLAVC